MKTMHWNFVDKTACPEGPWKSEPDKMQWLDEATGLPCLVHRSGLTGVLCGYVGVPPTHHFHAKDYSDIDGINVHGGLTFADGCHGQNETGCGICHVVETGENDNVWWLGFDCGHAGDLCPLFPPHLRDGDYCDLDYVKSECGSLARQLKAIPASAPRVMGDAMMGEKVDHV